MGPPFGLVRLVGLGPRGVAVGVAGVIKLPHIISSTSNFVISMCAAAKKR
jgi:hypothetical protein